MQLDTAAVGLNGFTHGHESGGRDADRPGGPDADRRRRRQPAEAVKRRIDPTDHQTTLVVTGLVLVVDVDSTADSRQGGGHNVAGLEFLQSHLQRVAVCADTGRGVQ